MNAKEFLEIKSIKNIENQFSEQDIEHNTICLMEDYSNFKNEELISLLKKIQNSGCLKGSNTVEMISLKIDYLTK